MTARALTAILLAAATVAAWSAKPLPRRHRTPVRQTETVADTVFSPDGIAVSGFEKPLRSDRESMFVTNRGADTIRGIGLEIEYTDMRGRMLHRARHNINPELAIAPGQTQMVYVASFDRHRLFYYYMTARPSRAAQATPFKAKVNVRYIVK